MHLISPLAAGVVGAENGSVAIFTRGTATRARLYEDFEAGASSVPTANSALDSDGRLIVYVNEIVTVNVYDSGGALVCSFVAGEQASAVEVRSASFTGVDYETAASAAGNPVPASTVFDRWLTSAGAIDFNVLLGGVSTTLQAAFGAIGGLVYNVTSSTYGATGNGTTDDGAAIQAAITACSNAGGGIVWFPEGTYLITAALSIPDKVSLMGAGAHCTTINCDHATESLLVYAGSTTARWQELAGLRLKYAQVSSGVHVDITAGSFVRVSGCDIGTSTQVAAAVVTRTSATLVANFYDCAIRMGDGAAGTCVTVAGTAKRVSFFGCTFIAPVAPAYDRMVYGDHITLVGCVFDLGSCTTTSDLYCYQAGSTTLKASITDCVFTADGGGSATTTAMKLGSPVAASQFYEANNTILCDTAYSYTITAANVGSNIRLATRDNRVKEVAVSATPAELPTDQYGVIIVTSTVAGSVTLTGVTPPAGSLGCVTVNNSDGSTRAFTLGGGFTCASQVTPGTQDPAASIATNSADLFDYYATVADPDSPVAVMAARWLINA